MVLDLKKIQAKHVIENVIRIFKIVLTDSKLIPNVKSSTFFRFLFNSKSGRKYKAFIKPQATYVMFAPCQKPLTKKMMNVFLT